MQPQGHQQVVSRLVDDGYDPQAALDAPRFYVAGGSPEGAVLLEDSAANETASKLKEAGHDVSIVGGLGRGTFGLGQVIMRYGNGVYCGGSDPRGDGLALGE
jgi:gamma-glutamyltranspeptidase/glutathione hydrolase